MVREINGKLVFGQWKFTTNEWIILNLLVGSIVVNIRLKYLKCICCQIKINPHYATQFRKSDDI